MELSVNEAAVYLGVSTNTIRRRLTSGVLNGHKVGNKWVINFENTQETARSAEADTMGQRSGMLAYHLSGIEHNRPVPDTENRRPDAGPMGETTMKLRTLSRFRTTARLTKKMVNYGRESLGRIRADIGEKEYLVFVEPVERHLKQRFGNRIEQAIKWRPGQDHSTVLETIPIEEPQPPRDKVTPESAVVSDIVDEIFAPPGSLASQRLEGLELNPSEPIGLDPIESEPNESEPNELDPIESEPNELDPNGDIADSNPEISSPSSSVETASSTAPKPSPKPVTPRATSQHSTFNPPMVRTMVEALPDTPSGEDSLDDYLAENLHDIFTVHSYSNPRTKALLRSKEHIDVYELARELSEYAREIGVSN